MLQKNGSKKVEKPLNKKTKKYIFFKIYELKERKIEGRRRGQGKLLCTIR